MLTVDARTSRPTTSNICRRSITTCGSGPAPKRPFNRNHFHYNWHWHWDYGNGDSGNQGPHQFDIARWGLQKQEHPVKIRSAGGYFGEESSQETPNYQTASSSTPTARCSSSARAAASPTTRAASKSATCSTARRAGCGSRRAGKTWQSYLRAEERKGTRRRLARRAAAEPTGLTTTEYPHYQNFIDAIRAGDPKLLTCDVLEGHLSSALPHLATSRIASAVSCSSTARPKRSSTTRKPTGC